MGREYRNAKDNYGWGGAVKEWLRGEGMGHNGCVTEACVAKLLGNIHILGNQIYA